MFALAVHALPRTSARRFGTGLFCPGDADISSNGSNSESAATACCIGTGEADNFVLTVVTHVANSEQIHTGTIAAKYQHQLVT